MDDFQRNSWRILLCPRTTLSVKGLGRMKQVVTVDVFVVTGDLFCGCSSTASWRSVSHGLVDGNSNIAALNSSWQLGIQINI